MARPIDKDASAKLTRELKLCETPSEIHQDMKAAIFLNTTRQRTGDDVDESIAKKIREDLPARILYSFIVFKWTTFIFRFACDFLRAEDMEYKRKPTIDTKSWVLVEIDGKIEVRKFCHKNWFCHWATGAGFSLSCTWT